MFRFEVNTMHSGYFLSIASYFTMGAEQKSNVNIHYYFNNIETFKIGIIYCLLHYETLKNTIYRERHHIYQEWFNLYSKNSIENLKNIVYEMYRSKKGEIPQTILEKTPNEIPNKLDNYESWEYDLTYPQIYRRQSYIPFSNITT